MSFQESEPCPNCDAPLIWNDGWIVCQECGFEQQVEPGREEAIF